MSEIGLTCLLALLIGCTAPQATSPNVPGSAPQATSSEREREYALKDATPAACEGEGESYPQRGARTWGNFRASWPEESAFTRQFRGQVSNTESGAVVEGWITEYQYANPNPPAAILGEYLTVSYVNTDLAAAAESQYEMPNRVETFSAWFEAPSGYEHFSYGSHSCTQAPVPTPTPTSTPAALALAAQFTAFSPDRAPANPDDNKDTNELTITTPSAQPWELDIVGNPGILDGTPSLKVGPASFVWNGKVNGITLPDGKYTLRLKAGAEEKTVEVILDTQAPAVSQASFTADTRTIEPYDFLLEGAVVDTGLAGLKEESASFSVTGISSSSADALTFDPETGLFQHTLTFNMQTLTDEKVEVVFSVDDKAGNNLKHKISPFIAISNPSAINTSPDIYIISNPEIGDWTLTVDGQPTPTAGGAGVIAKNSGNAHIQWLGSVGTLILPDADYMLRLSRGQQSTTTQVATTPVPGGGGGQKGQRTSYEGPSRDPWNLTPGVDSIKIYRYPGPIYGAGLRADLQRIATLRGQRIPDPLPRNASDIELMGKAWVGPNPITIINRNPAHASSGQIIGLRSQDGLRVYRYPSEKAYESGRLANLELYGKSNTHVKGQTKITRVLDYHIRLIENSPSYYGGTRFYPQ